MRRASPIHALIPPLENEKQSINFGGLKLTKRSGSSRALRAIVLCSFIANASFFFLSGNTEHSKAATQFSDDFNDGWTDTSKWTQGVLTRSTSEHDANVTVVEQSGNLTITPRTKSSSRDYNGVISTVGTDLTAGTARVQIVQAATSKAETIFSIGIDRDNFFRFRAKGSTLYLENAANGNTSSSSTSFNASQQRFWRFRHDANANKITFETSADGSNWSSKRSVTRAISITNLFAELAGGTSTSISTPGKAVFDNFAFVSGGTATVPTPTPTPGIPQLPAPTPTPTPAPTATPAPTPASSQDGVRGYLTTPGELRSIRQKADQQMQPYKAAYDSLMSFVGSPSTWPTSDFTGTNMCTNRDAFQAAAAHVYAQTLAYHLTGDAGYASEARKHILEISRSVTSGYEYGGGGDGCPLTMSRHVPGYIVAADLLEGYPGWTAADKSVFLDWLNNHAYHLVDWASDERSTNWGADGSNAAGIIADYFANSGRNLRDRNGSSWTPRQAYEEAKALQLHRMNGTTDHSTGDPFPKMKNSVCRNFTATSSTDGFAHGIQPWGSIPEESGRGTTGCAGTVLLSADSAWTYMHTSLTGMIMQAEMLLRRGDRSMYDNLKSNGNGSLETAMEFTLTPFGAYSSRTSIFELGYRYYKNPMIGAAIGVSGSRKIAGGTNTVFLHFGTLTHGFAPGENPGLPPAVPAP
jgi:hypothetical protein